MSVEAENKARVARFFEALNAGDSRAIVESYAQDGAVWTSGRTMISGTFDKAQISAASTAIFDAFPAGLKFTVHGMVAEGDKVAVEAESDGVHASGARYNNLYHFLFEFRGGKLVLLKEYMDTELVTGILCGGVRPGGNG
jgi:ketosteroid isomerase-like protein